MKEGTSKKQRAPVDFCLNYGNNAHIATETRSCIEGVGRAGGKHVITEHGCQLITLTIRGSPSVVGLSNESSYHSAGCSCCCWLAASTMGCGRVVTNSTSLVLGASTSTTLQLYNHTHNHFHTRLSTTIPNSELWVLK